jgi:uncharacterized protein (TIGR03435 family)
MRRHIARIMAVALPAIIWAQSPGARSEFEVASIKRNVSGDLGRYIKPAPGRVSVSNMTVKDLLTMAYQVRDFQISGGPGWVNSDRYDIEAKTGGIATPKQVQQMLRTLVEGRFKLKIHRETKELPIYELAVAKGGLKIQPAKEGSCIELDPSKQVPTDRQASEFCGYSGMRGGSLEATKQKMPDLAMSLSFILARTVIDKTGLKEAFDIHLAFAPLNGPDSTGPSIFTAVQEQLGLRLESGKGPVEVLAIDEVERPSEN